MSLTSNQRIKVLNQTVYVVIIDCHKNVRRHGVGIAAEICRKIVVEMFEAMQSGMMESEKRISKASSTFGRLHKHLWKRFTIVQAE